MEQIDNLKLENQLCFPLYAAANMVIRQYKPLLDKLDLTYTQYITMMCLWELKEINVKELGNKLFLDSGTLSPLLKKLEQKGFILRKRSEKDERMLIVKITQKGINLKERAKYIPNKVSKCINLNEKEAIDLYKTLYKLLNREE